MRIEDYRDHLVRQGAIVQVKHHLYGPFYPVIYDYRAAAKQISPNHVAILPLDKKRPITVVDQQELELFYRLTYIAPLAPKMRLRFLHPRVLAITALLRLLDRFGYWLE